MLEWLSLCDCGKFNHLIKISFVIICFGFHKKKFQPLTTFFYELGMCFFIKPPLMFIVIVVVPTISMTFA
jgi:hypothetical protein